VSSPLGRNSSIGHLVPSCNFPSMSFTVCRSSLSGRGLMRALRETCGFLCGSETTRGLPGAKYLCATVYTHRTVCSWSVVSVLSVSATAVWVTAVSSSSMLTAVSAPDICKKYALFCRRVSYSFIWFPNLIMLWLINWSYCYFERDTV